MSTRFRCYALSVLSALFLVAAPVWAQFNASIQGTVTDATGAIVQKASVVVTNQATGVTNSTTTSMQGFYRVGALPPGQYTVTVEAPGFKKQVVSGVQVAAETARGLNLKLQVGGDTESITVTDAAPALQTENANISTAITTSQILRLPQYGRDPYELLRMAPGVFGDDARSGSGGSVSLPNTPGTGGSNQSIFQTENTVQVSANGQRVTGNNYMIDGTSVNSLTWGGAAIVTPNQESVKEVTVLSNSYSAEDGRNSGAQVKVVTKGGTNSIHGSAFFLYDEPGLNAYNRWGGPDGQDPQRVSNKVRQFGGSIGGPIVKDKLFFFFSYEGDRTGNTTYQTQYLETPQFDQSILSGRSDTVLATLLGSQGAQPRIVQTLTPNCADLNGQWPSYSGCQVVNGGLDVGSMALSYGQYVPTWTGDTTGGGLDGIPDLQKAVVAFPTHSNGNQYNTRVDFAHGKDLFAASMYITPRNDLGSSGNSRPIQDMTFQPRNGYIALLWNRTFSPTLLNEARFNITRFSADQYASNSSLLWGLPRLEIEMIPNNRISWGPNQGDNSPGVFAQNQFEFRDVVSKVWGRHDTKFGFDFAANQDNNNTMLGSARPIFVFHGLWNFANGAPIYEGVNADPRTGAPTVNHKYFRQRDFAFFGQDSLKLRPNLTINIGLRYEYFAPLSEKNGNMSNLVLGQGPTGLLNAQLKVGSPLYQADRNNFAPRIGFAWSPSKLGNTTVVRGGFGVFYNRITDTMTGISRVNPPFVYRYGICCAMSDADLAVNGWAMPPFGNGQIDMNVVGSNVNSIYNFGPNPVLANNFDPTTGLPLTGQVEIWGAPQNDRTPYVYSYSLDLQRELPAKFVASLGYQGSVSHKLLRIVNQNFIYAQLNPLFNAVYFPTTDVNANYNALLANLTKRFSHSFQLYAKYRWSKSFDTLSGEGAGAQTNQFYPINQRWDYGPSDFDTTHNIMITGMWDLPILSHRNDLLGKAFGGWHIDGTFQFHSGFPWSAKTGACLPVPAGGNSICPSLPYAYLGGAGSDYSTSTFMQPGGNFPNGGSAYFDLSQQGPPFVNRNSFRGPRYSTVDLSLAKTTRVPFVTSEGASLDFRANFYNAFNKLNLKPFEYFDNSTMITDTHFGQASGALAGRVIEFQTRLTF